MKTLKLLMFVMLAIALGHAQSSHTFVDTTTTQTLTGQKTFNNIRLGSGTPGGCVHVDNNLQLVVDSASCVNGKVPAGGTTGQVLTKDSNVDYAYSWQNAAGGGSSLTGYTTVTTTIAAAITTACAASGGVYIPANYSGTDSFTNSCNAPIIDGRTVGVLRGGAISVRDFGARGDGGYYPTVSVNSGATSVVINAVWKTGSMVNGTAICIQGAGTAGADYCGTITSVSGGTINFTPATSTTVSNVGVYWGHDDTANIQAAINYAHSIGGGTITFPETAGDYIVSNVTIPAIDNTVTLKRGGITLECNGRRETTYLVGIGADQTDIITVAAGGHPTKIKGCGFVGFSWSSTWPANYRSFTTSDITTNYVSTPDNAVFDSTTVTVGMDFAAAVTPAANTWIVAKNSGVNPPSYGFKTNASGNLVCVSTDNFNNQIVSPATTNAVWDNNFHRAVCIVDAVTNHIIRLYVDGSEVGSGTAYPNSIGYTSPSILSMGGSNSNPGIVIKLARVWTRSNALTTSAAASASSLSAVGDPPASVLFRFNATSPEIDAVVGLSATVIGTTTVQLNAGSLRHVNAINILGGIEHEITDNFFDSGLYNAIKATSTFNNRFHFNRFYGPWDSCIRFVSGSSAVIDTTIDTNEFGVCGASHYHGWALEQTSQGGGGSNWLRILNNDCEGTEWNGCWYMGTTTSYVIDNNRTEVDTSVGDGSWATLYNKSSNGVAHNNELSGGVTMDGGTLNLFNNNMFKSTITNCALTLAAGGGQVQVVGNGAVSNMTKADVCNDPSNTVKFINQLEGVYVSNAFHIYNGIGGSGEPSNQRKQAFYDLSAPGGGSINGWGNALQGTSNTAAQRLPVAVTGAVFSAGDKIYNGYWGTGANGALNFGWVCMTTTCSWNGTAWTGSWDYLNSDHFIRQWGTAAPIAGFWAVGDQVYNNNFDGGSNTVYKWLCTVGGNPGTWKAIYIMDPTVPPALGTTTPASGAFTTLSASGTLSVLGAATFQNSVTVNQPTQGTQGVLAKAASSGLPNTITCGGSCSLQAWWKADSLALSDGANVTSWADSSGNGHTLTNTGTAPVYHTNIQNSQPGVQFVNVTTGKLSTTSWGFTGAYSVVWVALKPVSYATDCQYVSFSGLNNFHYPLSTATNWSMRNNGGSAGYPSYTATGYPDDGKSHIITNTVSQFNSQGYVDGTNVVSNVTSTSFLDNSGGVNVNLFSTCSNTLQELIIYSGTLDATSRKSLEGYLGIKYGITATAAYIMEVQDNSSVHLAGITPTGKIDGKGFAGGQTTVSFSATPTFDASTTNAFKLTLTGNVTSSQLTNAALGQPLMFEICQDGTGGRTMTWPTSIVGAGVIDSTANACSTQTFQFDGTNVVATTQMTTNTGAQMIPIAPVSLTAQAASVGTTNLIASAPAGQYQFCYSIVSTQAATTSSSILVTAGWNNGTAKTRASTAVTTNTVGDEDSNCYILNVAASTAISYATTYSSTGATPYQYALKVNVRRIQ